MATRCKPIQTMVGFKSKAYDWLVLNSTQEGLRLVGFKYQKADDWLDSKFHCSYLECRGVPEKRTTGNYLPFISGFGSRLSVMPLPVTSLLLHKCGLNCPPILLTGIPPSRLIYHVKTTVESAIQWEGSINGRVNVLFQIIWGNITVGSIIVVDICTLVGINSINWQYMATNTTLKCYFFHCNFTGRHLCFKLDHARSSIRLIQGSWFWH